MKYLVQVPTIGLNTQKEALNKCITVTDNLLNTSNSGFSDGITSKYGSSHANYQKTWYQPYSPQVSPVGYRFENMNKPTESNFTSNSPFALEVTVKLTEQFLHVNQGYVLANGMYVLSWEAPKRRSINLTWNTSDFLNLLGNNSTLPWLEITLAVYYDLQLKKVLIFGPLVEKLNSSNINTPPTSFVKFDTASPYSPSDFSDTTRYLFQRVWLGGFRMTLMNWGNWTENMIYDVTDFHNHVPTVTFARRCSDEQ